MPKEKLNYFISILNSNIFTVKNKSKLEFTNISTYNRKYSLGQKKKLEDNLKLVTMSMNFLPIPEYISLLQVNKKFNLKVSRKLCKKVLLETPNIPLQKRLSVWKTMLKFVRIVLLISRVILRKSIITRTY